MHIYKGCATLSLHDSPCCVTWLSAWWQCGQLKPGLWWLRTGASGQPSPSLSYHWTLWRVHQTGMARLIPHLLAGLWYHLQDGREGYSLVQQQSHTDTFFRPICCLIFSCCRYILLVYRGATIGLFLSSCQFVYLNSYSYCICRYRVLIL